MHELRLQTHWEETLNRLLDVAGRMPRSQRFLFAQPLSQLGVDLLLAIHELRYLPRPSQGEQLAHADKLLSRIRLLSRLCHDRRLMSTGQLEELSRRFLEAGKMIGGWRSQCAI